MADPRTFKLGKTSMKGDDIKAWERELKELFNGVGIDAPIVPNGVYGDIDRSYTKSFAYAVGFDAVDVLDDGIEPKDRTRLRHWRTEQTNTERQRMEARKDWRRRLRDRYAQLRDADQGDVSRFVQKLLADSWGYHPGVHDGIDLITLPDVPLFAPVRARVIDVRKLGWWSLGAKASSGHSISEGDGIVQLEILDEEGPFHKGWHIGYGHAEKSKRKVGEVVDAGDEVAHAGFANAWHAHLVYNDGTLGLQGRGNRDPRAIVEYSKKHG